jgi:hypothetical protein
MPVTVDLPLVPATAIPAPLVLNRIELSSARVSLRQPSSAARAISGTLSSTAALATTTWSGERTPLPSCGYSTNPSRSSARNFSGVRP